MDTTSTRPRRRKTALHTNRIVIVGPPNVGKSSLFNKFSRTYSVTANYPQTTIEDVRKETVIGGKTFEVIDTPGIASLSLQSEDERVTRDILLDEHPEVILFCADSTRLKRSLYLFGQIAELGIPTVLCLNMTDEAAARGLTVDRAQVARETGVPVVELAAVHGTGLADVIRAIAEAAPPPSPVTYGREIEEGLAAVAGQFPAERPLARGVARLALMGERGIDERVEARYGPPYREAVERAREILRHRISAGSVRHAMIHAHEVWADRVVDRVVKGTFRAPSGLALRAASLSRHPLWGWPILLGIMYLTFQGVAVIATAMAGALDQFVFAPLTGTIAAALPDGGFEEFLVGNFGILTMGVMNAVVTVVPILIVFFFILNLLEDVGYLPNLSVLANRGMAKLGMTGKASLMVALGFGCNTMATLATRMLETKKERIIVSFLIALGVPCAVQLGVMIAILSTAPFAALLIVLGTVVATQVAAGLALNRMIPAPERGEFIQELPHFRMPVWRYTLRKTYHRVMWFLREALPLFVLGAALMFGLEKSHLLGVIERVMAPVVRGLLSLPDKVTEVFILVLSRRELGAAYFKELVDAGGLDFIQVVVGLVVITLFIPCISNTMVMVKELGLKWAAAINTAIMVVAVLVGGLLDFALRAIL